MKEQTSLEERFPFLNITILQERIKWSIRLRWLAILGYFFATYIAREYLHLHLKYPMIWNLLAGLGVINLLYYVVLKIWTDFSFQAEVWLLRIHIFVDLLFLAFILHFSGGIENPAFLFFIFHVVLSSILFGRLISLMYSFLVIFLFASVVLLEMMGIIPHYIVFDPHVYKNVVSTLLIIFTFGITVLSTNYICTGFMKIYRESKRIIDKQNRKLIELDEQKTRFFQFASHELKSPIIAIKSTLDAVLKGYSGTVDKRALGLIQRATNRSEQMLGMLTKLLELNHLRRSELKNDIPALDIHQRIKKIIQDYQARIKEKDLAIELKFSKTILNATIDAEDFEKILGNLISNGIRYSHPKGKLTIATSEESPFVQITVQDNGIGIAAEDQGLIFTEFFRSKEAKKKVSFGTGLGLSLVKQLVDKNKGTISVESEVGKGTTFILNLLQSRSYV